MSALEHVTTDQFQQTVLDSQQPVLVDFYADWCGPCRAMAPILEKLADEVADKARIVKVNVDEEGELAARFRVMSIPTLILFRGGQAVKTIVGLTAATELRKLIEANRPSPLAADCRQAETGGFP
jgi:thioredoxin 1